MHVLQLLPALEVGGVERGVLDLTKGLIARGHRVSVVSAGGPLVEPLTRLGATHYDLPVNEKSLQALYACVPEVARIIRTTGIDLVHARSRMPGWVGWFAARRAQCPFVTTAHGFYRAHPLSRVMVYGRRVIAPSVALGDYLVEQFHLPRERLRIVPRGVDLETFQFAPSTGTHDSPWRIGLFGRLTAIKGHEVALRACAQLIQQGMAVKLCIVGDTPQASLRGILESVVESLKLRDIVEWLGVREDIPALLASMDAVIVPSTYPESFGRTVVEAQAVGRPVVASRIGALPELIEDGRQGLLVRPGDPQALAEALARLLTDPALRARCVEAGRRRVEAEWHLGRMVDATLAAYDECLHEPRILIWKLSALGDVVLATPSLRAIRRQFPRARTTLVVGRATFEVVARCPYLNDIIIFDAKGKDRGPWRQWKFLRRLRRSAFDLSVDLQNSRKTHLMAWLAGIPVRIGYARKFGWLLNRGVRVPRVVLAPVAHQHYLLTKAGIAPDGEALELWPSMLEEQDADEFLASTRRGAQRQIVGVHPGGSGRWKTKRWDLERWARLCDALAQRNIRVVITGGPEEQPLGVALTRMMSSKPVNAIGQTSLLGLACLIKRCDAFVAHDSASLHLAAAVGTRAVALFGPTDPARHLPPSFVGQVITRDVFCGPCYSPSCRTITHACMKRIGVDDVLAAVLGQLADAELAQAGARK